MSNLPNIKIDTVLGMFPDLEEGTVQPTPKVIQGLWKYIKEQNLKVAKVKKDLKLGYNKEIKV